MMQWLTILVLLQGLATGSHDNSGVVGCRVGVLNHRIQRVYEGTPAAAVGMQPGDKVISVIDEYGKKDLAGIAGAEVIVLVQRGDQPLVFRLTRVPESTIVRK